MMGPPEMPGSPWGPRPGIPGITGGPPPPPGPSPGPGPGPGSDPFIEEQVEMLAEKIDGLEGELRYAWRALDILSQEYVKMWQRLEKMEGLLSEQQTVITQLIDLYSADSSDGNGTNDGLGPGLSPDLDLSGTGSGRVVGPPSGGKSGIPDENFYKALNQVHSEGNADMQLALLSASHSIEDFISPDKDMGSEENTEDEGSEKVVFPPSGHKTHKLRGDDAYVTKQGSFNDFMRGKTTGGGSRSGSKTRKAKRKNSQGSEGDSTDAKSVTSSVRSSYSANTVKSEDVGEFPLPGDLSPGYDNTTPTTPPTVKKAKAGSRNKQSTAPELPPKAGAKKA